MMITWKYLAWNLSLILGIGLILISCNQSDYTKLVKSELKKGIRQDSVLLGIYLQDTKDEFFGKCFDLNKQKLISQGPSNLGVQYMLRDSLEHESPEDIKLIFYTTFDNTGRISNIDMEFSYISWSPWNKKYQSDILKDKLMKLLIRWYGGNDFVMAHVGEHDIPVKLDGNRRILVELRDTQTVVVRVQDILNDKFKHSINR